MPRAETYFMGENTCNLSFNPFINPSFIFMYEILFLCFYTLFYAYIFLDEAYTCMLISLIIYNKMDLDLIFLA